jgi:hypothetical protein
MVCECISPDLIVQGFKKCCILNALDRSDDGRLCSDSEEVGDVATCVRKMKTLAVKMDTRKNGGRGSDNDR